MDKVTRINRWQLAKLQAMLTGLLGLLAGIYYSLGGLLMDLFVSLGWINCPETPGLGWGSVLALGALIAMPVLGAAAGFLVGILQAGMYNLVAGWFGGIRMDCSRLFE